MGDAPGAFDAPSYDPPGQVPGYGAPAVPGQGDAWAQAGGAAFGGAANTGVGVPAEFGPRALAWLIDWAPWFVIAIINQAIGNAALGALISLIGLGYLIWNFIVKQGQTGQTIGKAQQGIRLVDDTTGQPVGAGKAFLRGVVAIGFSLLCGVGRIVDLLWPLFDDDNKRLTDKILKFSVVRA